MDITKNKSLLFVLTANIECLKQNIRKLTNRSLFDMFKKHFIAIDSYKCTNDNDKYQVLDFSASFIEEFITRAENGADTGLLELAKLVQLEMGDCKQDNYYTRNLIRLYSRLISIMQSRNIDKKLIKKEYL